MASKTRPKRRHAAAASRVLAGGVSVAATFGLTAHWGIQAQESETVAVETAAATSAEPQQRTVIIRRIIREVYAEPTEAAAGSGTAPVQPATTAAVPAPAAAPAAAEAPAAAATPTLPSAALAPAPAAPAPTPATSSNGS